jgi:hypothetical protein
MEAAGEWELHAKEIFEQVKTAARRRGGVRGYEYET